jgi:hypothetical protein
MAAAILFTGSSRVTSSPMDPIRAEVPAEAGYWPAQSAPGAWRRVPVRDPLNPLASDDTTGRFPTAYHATAASLAGVAARAVNEGRHDELLWLDIPRPIYEEWLQRTVTTNGLTERPPSELLPLIADYHRQGLVRGYVLYRGDASEGRSYREREAVDHSVNAGTMIAGALGNLIIADESMEPRVQEIGLPRLFDARGMSELDALARYGERLSTRGVITIDPKNAQLRDYAIAHALPVTYGTGETFLTMLARSEPNALILGWNSGHEDQHTAPPTRYGLVQTASNWAMNLPFLAIGDATAGASLPASPPAEPPIEPDTPLAAFMISDGDNVQFLLGSFFEIESFWPSTLRGSVPVGWSICGIHLAQVAPVILTKLREMATASDNFIEFSGGYFYPDLFGAERADRREILRTHARMMARQMEASGTRTLTFICKDVASEASHEAYQIFANEIPGLIGMIAVQYYPYNGGQGSIHWVETADGDRVPVITPRYCIWENARWRGGGTPAHVARLINEFSTSTTDPDDPPFSLVSVHAWSIFREIEGDDETAENIPSAERETIRRRDGRGGLWPIKWTIDRLNPSVRVVTPEQMLVELRAWDARRRKENNP